MTDAREIMLAVLGTLTDSIRKLKAEQVEQVINGKAELRFVPPGATVAFAGPSIDDIRPRLSTARTRREASEYLTGLKLKKAELVSIARQLDVAVLSRDTMPVIEKKIIDATAGFREDAAAIRGHNNQS